MKIFACIFLVALFKGTLSDTCPFENGNNCNCVPATPDSKNGNTFYVFSTVDCKPSNGKVIPFTGPAIYNVTTELSIFSNFDNITVPANAFGCFSAINRLTFVNAAATTVVSITLDPAAFNGVQPAALTFSGFDTLPIPDAVRSAGKNGLNELVIQNGKEGTLPANQFQGFTNLIILTIYNTPIRSISDSAFAGLESTLQYLTLGPNAVSDFRFPQTALSKLTKLVFLDLSGNNINSWPEGAFERFASLKELRLSQNDLQSAVNAGTFNHMPDTVEYMDLTYGNIQSLPRTVLVNARGLVEVYLGANLITSLTSTAFPDNLKLSKIDLSQNPLKTIDPKAFEPLKTVENVVLKQTLMDSIDLAVFNGMDKLRVVNLDFQRAPQFGLNASNADLVPITLQKVTLQYTTLKWLDSKLEEIITSPDFQTLDITRDPIVYCDCNWNWIAKFNPVHINSAGTRCANSGVLLRDYLKSPQPC